MPDLGDTLSFRSDLYDKPAEDGGVLVNAASAALTVTLPDGTTASPTVTNATTGQYAASYQTTLASPQGRYVGQWVFTFIGGATTAYVETFDVGRSLVTVDEALQHLRAADVLDHDADVEYLQFLTFVATDAVERDLGRVIMPRTVVETYNGGASTIVLRSTPVMSVTSVTQSGTAIADFIAEGAILYRSYYGCWMRGRQNITVTYVAGYANPPYVARKVALNAIQGMWQESQQAFHQGLDEFTAGAAVGTAAAQLTPLEQSAYNTLRSSGVA